MCMFGFCVVLFVCLCIYGGRLLIVIDICGYGDCLGLWFFVGIFCGYGFGSWLGFVCVGNF